MAAGQTPMKDAQIKDALQRLEGWLDSNGWAGYDSFDLIGLPLFQLSGRSPVTKGALQPFRRVVFRAARRFPLTMRRLLLVKEEINPETVGLLATGYLNLYQVSGGQRYLEKAESCLQWLRQHQASGYTGTGWGYPFHWQSQVFIPRGTPCSMLTFTVSDAFWSHYRLRGDRESLQICEEVCQFFLGNLNQHHIDSRRLCFSYTPVDTFRVHNTNLMVAQLLIRIGKERGLTDYLAYGERALNFSLSEQTSDGSFYYWGLPDSSSSMYNPPPENLLYVIDHIHTGFVLRSLYSIYQDTKRQDVREALEKGFQYYLDNMFDNDGAPKMYPDRRYPVDTHSCAEAILCLTVLSDLFPEGIKMLEKVAAWTIANMQDKTGYFYYQSLPGRTVRIPYIRWGPAWMLYALSSLLLLPRKEHAGGALKSSQSRSYTCG